MFLPPSSVGGLARSQARRDTVDLATLPAGSQARARSASSLGRGLARLLSVFDRMTSQPTTRRWQRMGRTPRRLIVTLGVLLALLVVVRLVLDPIAAHYTRKALSSGEGFRGAFSDVHVSILPPGFEIERLKIIEHPRGRWKDPIYYVEKARVSIL